MGLAYTQRSDGKYEFKGNDGKTYVSNDPTTGWKEEKPSTPSTPTTPIIPGAPSTGLIPSNNKSGGNGVNDYLSGQGWKQDAGGQWYLPGEPQQGSFVSTGTTLEQQRQNNQNQYTPYQPYQSNYQYPSYQSIDFEDTWNKFMEWAQPYMKKPDISTPDYDEILDRYTSRTKPLYDYQMDIANRNKQNDITALMENLASRGVYNSDMNETEAAKIYANYATDQALRDANYQAILAELTDSAYQNQLNQALAYEQQWNQNMLNLGLQLLNGQIDEARFISDDAYRNALLFQGIANDVLSQFGIIK